MAEWLSAGCDCVCVMVRLRRKTEIVAKEAIATASKPQLIAALKRCIETIPTVFRRLDCWPLMIFDVSLPIFFCYCFFFVFVGFHVHVPCIITVHRAQARISECYYYELDYSAYFFLLFSITLF